PKSPKKVGFARFATGAACAAAPVSCGATARVLVVFFAAFFATFLGDFGAAFFAAFFAALPAFFTVRFVFVAPFLAARFFAAAFLPARAGSALRVFFALRFFEAFFPAFATTNSFSTQRYQGLLSDGALPRRFREHPKHRENQRFSLQII